MKLKQKIINTFAILLTITFFLFVLLFKAHSIPAESMSPNIPEGSHVIVTKWGFGEFVKLGMPKAKIKRGNVYVFKLPNSDTLLIKRVIGLPGDEIVIENDKVFVNGKRLKTEPVSTSNNISIMLETVEEKSYLIKKNQQSPYLHSNQTKVGEKQYYVLGDNRDASADSRYWGTIPLDSFTSELVYIIKNDE